MFVVRNVFTCKPGKAKELIAKFKAAEPHMSSMGVHGMRVLSDVAAGFWTVVLEIEAETLDEYMGVVQKRATSPELQRAMDGYMELVSGGAREIFKIE